MNALNAAKETIEAWRSSKQTFPQLVPELTFEHCLDMLQRMQEPNFSYGKQCRWLGWMQAACVASTDCTLEQMKNINMRNKD